MARRDTIRLQNLRRQFWQALRDNADEHTLNALLKAMEAAPERRRPSGHIPTKG
jgi:hypothetical protein